MEHTGTATCPACGFTVDPQDYPAASSALKIKAGGSNFVFLLAHHVGWPRVVLIVAQDGAAQRSGSGGEYLYNVFKNSSNFSFCRPVRFVP